jgi:hypothetical protein
VLQNPHVIDPRNNWSRRGGAVVSAAERFVLIDGYSACGR